VLNLGYPLLTVDDVMALKALVREQYQRVGRPLRGVEIGPWLGRSTVSMLAADLPLGLPLPFDNHLYEFITASTPDQGTFQWSWRVERKHQYFEQLWCFDTWRGITSETLQYFRETATGVPKRMFLENIERAGFERSSQRLNERRRRLNRLFLARWILSSSMETTSLPRSWRTSMRLGP
jgi:hypothetical protein